MCNLENEQVETKAAILIGPRAIERIFFPVHSSLWRHHFVFVSRILVLRFGKMRQRKTKCHAEFINLFERLGEFFLAFFVISNVRKEFQLSFGLRVCDSMNNTRFCFSFSCTTIVSMVFTVHCSQQINYWNKLTITTTGTNGRRKRAEKTREKTSATMNKTESSRTPKRKKEKENCFEFVNCILVVCSVGVETFLKFLFSTFFRDFLFLFENIVGIFFLLSMQ